MFERFTDRARRVVVLAQEEARMLNHNYIGTEHILLGLIHEGDGVAARALRALQINLAAVRREVEQIIGVGQRQPSGHIPFTPRAKKVLEFALRESLQLGHDHIGTEHILLGLIREGQGVAAQVLTTLGADLNLVRRQVVQLLHGGLAAEPATGATPTARGHAVDRFCRQLSEAARSERFDPVIGRAAEIERLVQLLATEPDVNPVLVGGRGAGKTSVVHGLAMRVASGDVPKELAKLDLYALDLGALVAGERGRTAFRRRLETTVQGVQERPNSVLFITDLHALLATEAIATASVLKPVISERALRVIGATTPQHFERHLTRGDLRDCRFRPIEIAECSAAEAMAVLEAVRHVYENLHGVTFAADALTTAVRLTDRHLGDRALPGKAIDLVDAAAAHVRAAGRSTASESGRRLKELARRISEVRREKEIAIDAQRFEQAGELRDQEKDLLEQQARVERAEAAEVTADLVAEVFATATGIPPTKSA
ncbi:MAG TPA: Clp protease N-terminal domain-containing protein [Streptosporangiaceae bacterium]|jgi:ATP-dependent Clp protease ATP-binding subunit ClpC